MRLLNEWLFPYGGKLSREKTFANFAVWGMVSIGVAKASNPRQSFLCKNCIVHQFAKVFSLKSFPLYGI